MVWEQLHTFVWFISFTEHSTPSFPMKHSFFVPQPRIWGQGGRNQILYFVQGHFLTKRNSKEIWRELVLKPRFLR
jgi:hypothetical protein